MYISAKGYEPSELPLLTVLNYSGGRQSSALLWMVLKGMLKPQGLFIVLNADPGMENSLTYDYNKMMFEECKRAGIIAYTVEGPNLYKDLVSLSETGKTRIDNPPYWTKGTGRKEGKLMQKCTQYYKIAPMDVAIRKVLEKEFGIARNNRRLGLGIVEKWIGFSSDEFERIKPPQNKYAYFRYPLIELEMDNEDVINFYIDHALPIPPRSVCNACFANGLATFKQMAQERPQDFRTAVQVDNAVRDLSQVGIDREVYVSKTLKSLEELERRGFSLEDELDEETLERLSCDSGYCFL